MSVRLRFSTELSHFVIRCAELERWQTGLFILIACDVNFHILLKLLIVWSLWNVPDVPLSLGTKLSRSSESSRNLVCFLAEVTDGFILTLLVSTCSITDLNDITLWISQVLIVKEFWHLINWILSQHLLSWTSIIHFFLYYFFCRW